MAETLASIFKSTIALGKPDAILTRESGAYKPVSSQEFERRVARVHLALRKLGIQPGDCCALLSENRWEWTTVDFAILTARAVTVPVYPTLPASQVKYILHHSESRVVFCSNRAQYSKILSIRKDLPALETIVTFDRVDSDGLVHMGDLIGDTPLSHEERHELYAGIGMVEPQDLASIIYTSGTTGTPKGVMLTHDNIVTNLRSSLLKVRTDDLALSFLPLSHIAERMVEFVCFDAGATVAYAESLEHVPINMQEVQPTLVMGVPRFYEKIRDRVMLSADAAPPWKKNLFHWARRVGKRVMDHQVAGRAVPAKDRIAFYFADRLVLSKLRERLGGRMRYCVSGAAPLGTDLAEFFHIFGLPIYEGYGMTETSPLVSVNTPNHVKFGSVGRIIPGVTVKVADDGEILVRGPNVMRGYFKMEELTSETIVDGWMHTGDIGHVDDDGFLWITDRKKDLIKTSGGKYIAPAPIENLLQRSSLIETAILVGERRNYPTALIVPQFEGLTQWAKGAGVACENNDQLCSDQRVHDRIMADVVTLSARLAQFEKIKKISLIPNALSIENEELTPTMKVRRKQVLDRYADRIEEMYNSKPAPAGTS